MVASEGTEVNGRMVSVREGAEGQSVTCQVSTRPPARIAWYRGADDTQVVARGATLALLPTVNRTHEGSYYCLATVAMTPTGRSAKDLFESRVVIIRVLCECAFVTVYILCLYYEISKNCGVYCTAIVGRAWIQVLLV